MDANVEAGLSSSDLCYRGCSIETERLAMGVHRIQVRYFITV